MGANWKSLIGASIVVARVLLVHSTLLYSQSADSVSGLLVGMDGTPLAGIQVRLKREGANRGEPSIAVTETDGSGQYRIENVPPGTYLVSAGTDGEVTATAFRALSIIMDVFSSRTVKIVYSPALSGPARVTIPGASNAGINIVLLPSAVKISGRIAIIPSMPFPSPLRVTLGGTAATTIVAEAEVQKDGTFEFSRIPPGSYALGLSPNLGISPLNVTVADQNLSGIELGGNSAGVRVSGNLLPSDRPLFQEMFAQWVYLVGRETARIETSGQGVPIGVTGPSDSEAKSPAPQIYVPGAAGDQLLLPVAAVGPQGRFEFLTIPAGVYSVRTQPDMGLANTTITVADKDVTNIRVGVGVRVRGSVIASNFGTRPPELINLTASGLNGKSVSAGVAADGTFEFPKVGPGTYRVLLDGKIRPTPSEISVADEELIVSVEAPFKPWVIGRVLFTGTSAPPDALANIHVALSNGFDSTIKPDGSFRLEANEGEHEFFVRSVPEGYFVRSIYHGADDLLNGPAKVDASTSPREIVVTLEYKPGPPQ